MKHSLFILLVVCLVGCKVVAQTTADTIYWEEIKNLPLFTIRSLNDSMLGRKDTVAIQMIVTGHDAGGLTLGGEPIYLIRGYAFRHWAYCFETIDRGFGGPSDYLCCPFTDGYLDENKKPLPKYYTIWLTK